MMISWTIWHYVIEMIHLFYHVLNLQAYPYSTSYIQANRKIYMKNSNTIYCFLTFSYWLLVWFDELRFYGNGVILVLNKSCVLQCAKLFAVWQFCVNVQGTRDRWMVDYFLTLFLFKNYNLALEYLSNKQGERRHCYFITLVAKFYNIFSLSLA